MVPLFNRSVAALLSLVFVLSACGSENFSPSFSETGGGTPTSGSSTFFNSGSTSVSPVVALPDYSSVMSFHPTVSEVDALIPDITAIGDAGAANRIFRDTPNASFARYDGIIAADLSLTQMVAGRIAMNVDFANSTFTANADNFTSFTVSSGVTTFDEDLSGSFTVPNGFVVGTGFGGTGAGTLTGTSGDTDIAATLDGVFIDNGGQNVALGLVDGAFTNTAGTFNFSGAVVATDR